METVYSFYTRDYSLHDLTASPHRIEYVWDAESGSGYAWDVHTQQRREHFRTRRELEAAIASREAEFAERDFQLEVQRLQEEEGLSILESVRKARAPGETGSGTPGESA